MLLESLVSIPLIIVAVINLFSVIKTIYCLLNHKRIFTCSDDWLWIDVLVKRNEIIMDI